MNAFQRTCINETLRLGFASIQDDQSALDAVESMIRNLEESGLFNAGVGSFLQLDGVRRMDSSLMEGTTLRAGAVANIEKIVHPISAARLVMDHTPHVLLIGQHATQLARRHRMSIARTSISKTLPVDHPAKHPNPQRKGRTSPIPCETVGAVALDRLGNLAAGASTGGVRHMLPGRVGDTPLIGGGVYADNACGAVSMTGIGERIMRLALAKHIAMELKHGASPEQAAREALQELAQRIQGKAGTIILTTDGRFTIKHTTPRMSAGYWDGQGQPLVRDQFHF